MRTTARRSRSASCARSLREAGIAPEAFDGALAEFRSLLAALPLPSLLLYDATTGTAKDTYDPKMDV
jgi:hypothetical protein